MQTFSEMFASLEIDQSPVGTRFRDSLLGILASTHTLRAVFERFVEVLARVIRFDRCALSRLMPDETVTILQVYTTYPERLLGPGQVLHLGSEYLQVLIGGQPHLIADLLDGSVAVPSPDLLSEGLRSLLIAPIHFRGEALGALVFGSRRTGAFVEADFAPAQAAAQMLGMVMAHQDLCDHLQELSSRRTVELEEVLRDTEALLKISRILLEPEAERRTFERVAQVVRESFGYGCCDILLWDAEGGQLVQESVTGIRAQRAPPIRVRLGEGIVGIAAAERIPIRVPQVDRDPRYVCVYPETRSELAVPMLAGERLLGVINVESPHADAFSQRDQELMRSIAQQVSLWVENRLLLAQREKAEGEARASAAELARINAELHRALEELQTSRAQLVQAEKLVSLGALVAGAAHELNNPLAAVQGYAEALLGQSLPAAMRQRLEMIYQQARRAGRIVEGLLGLARPSWDLKLADRRTRCFLAEALERPLTLRAEELAGQGISLTVSLDPDIAVRADLADIQQVVAHLLENAEYALREASRKEIIVKVRRERGYAELQVGDTGPGIPEEALPRVFDPFFTTKPVGYAGLGLSICFGIITAYGGSLRAANRPPGGAVFTVLLPAAEAPETPVSPAPPGCSILVVDHEEGARRLLQEILLRANYQVTAASSASEALERLGQARFDLVISNLRMPQTDGFQLHREMRRRGLPTPLLFVSEEAPDPTQQQSLAESGCSLLLKPFRLNEVRRVIEEQLDKLDH